MSSDGHMDVDDRIATSGCEAQYRLLEDCIVESNRDWRMCQQEVMELRRCMGARSVSISARQSESKSPEI